MDKNEMKEQATAWAKGVVSEIEKAINSPVYKIEGDALKAYNSLSEWEWFTHNRLDDPSGRKNTILLLSIEKYAKIKWAKEHPPKRKLSKWEKVTGKTRR